MKLEVESVDIVLSFEFTRRTTDLWVRSMLPWRDMFLGYTIDCRVFLIYKHVGLRVNCLEVQVNISETNIIHKDIESFINSYLLRQVKAQKT